MIYLLTFLLGCGIGFVVCDAWLWRKREVEPEQTPEKVAARQQRYKKIYGDIDHTPELPGCDHLWRCVGGTVDFPIYACKVCGGQRP